MSVCLPAWIPLNVRTLARSMFQLCASVTPVCTAYTVLRESSEIPFGKLLDSRFAPLAGSISVERWNVRRLNVSDSR